MAIGRYRSFDLAGDEPLLTFFRRQRDRINKRMAARAQPKALNADGGWVLTVRGAQPAQIALDNAPIMPGESSRGPKDGPR